MFHPQASKDVQLAAGLVVEYWLETLRGAGLTVQRFPCVTLGKHLNPSAPVAACPLPRHFGRFWHSCPLILFSALAVQP